MENEFLKDIVELNEAIENFGYLNEEVLEESLFLHIRKEDMDKILQIPIGKLFATLNNSDVFSELRDKPNKKMSDYKITGRDSILSVNKMKIFVYINGDKDQKELMHDKIESLEKKIAASHKKDDEIFDIPYGSIKAIYSLYKRVEKVSLKEDADSRRLISDEKYAVKNDPEEYIYKKTMNCPSLLAFLKWNRGGQDKTADIASRRIEKMENYPELKSIANKLKAELSKRPIDREETDKLIAEFKKLYKSSSIKHDVKIDQKLEKINSKRKVSLSEAVTFVDNAGNVQTTSTEDYVKSMHNIHDPREIENMSEEEYMKELEDFYKEFNLIKKFDIKKDKDGKIISVYED